MIKNNKQPITFQIGDKILIKTDDMIIRRQKCPKRKQRYVGPYEVIEQVNPQAYKLQLPPELECHPVFHVSKLRPWDTVCAQTDIPNALIGRQTRRTDDPIIADITDCKLALYPRLYAKGNFLLFKVRFHNFPAPGDDSMPYETMRYSPLMQHFMLSERFKNISTSPAYLAAKASHRQRFSP